MGGILVTTSIDVEQLGCISDVPMVVSPNILVLSDLFCLRQFVRLRNGKSIQELIVLSQKSRVNSLLPPGVETA
eukprot:13833133-Ditylum_brightwellii.AAC.1